MHPGAPSCSFNARPILPSCMLDVCSFLRSEKAYKAKSQSSPQQHFWPALARGTLYPLGWQWAI